MSLKWVKFSNKSKKTGRGHKFGGTIGQRKSKISNVFSNFDEFVATNGYRK